MTVNVTTPLDSGLRRNDGGGAGMTAGEAGMTVDMTTRPNWKRWLRGGVRFTIFGGDFIIWGKGAGRLQPLPSCGIG